MAQKIIHAGRTTTTTGTSQAFAMPTLDGSANPRFVRVTASTLAYIKFGNSASLTVTANDILISSTPTIFDVAGVSHYAVLQETASAKVSITPLSNEH